MTCRETAKRDPPAVDRDQIGRLVVEKASCLAIIGADMHGCVFSWNPGAERLFGWSAEEMVGTDLGRIFTTEDRAANVCAAEMARAAGEHQVVDERWLVRKDGTRFWGASLLMGLDGEGQDQAGGYLKVVQDRTAEHEAVEQRLAAHQCSAEILESISDAFYAVDADWRFTYVNRRTEQLWGHARQELLGRILWEAFPEAIGSQAAAFYCDAMRDRQPVHLETLSAIIDRWIEVDVYPTDTGGLAVYFRDISERRLREARLRDSEARLRLAVEGGQIAIWEYDIRTEQVAVTPELAAILHLTPEQAEDRAFMTSRYYPGDWEHVRSVGATAVTRGERYFEAEFRLRGGDDQFRWFMLRAEILHSETVEPERIIGVLLDITGRKAAEEALRKLTDTLEEQVIERSHALVQTEEALRQSQKLEAIGQLTGGVAHDFNNLLTIIRSSIDLLKRSELAEDRRRRYMDAISDTVERATKLTGQLLAFARRQALKPEIFDAADRICGIADMIRTLVGARIDLVLPDRISNGFVEADVGQFETAVVNMVVNARDAMKGAGTLTIGVQPICGLPAIRGHQAGEGDFIAVTVTDTGSGIAPDILSHLFEPFFTTKPVGKGTGLGLSQVYGFAKQSGGDVQVNSRVGHGTTFTLYLPRVSSPQPDKARPLPPATVAGPRQRILLVEDNVQVGEFATGLLKELGHDVTLANNAEAALALLERDGAAFDLLFTDVVMPGLSGVELGERVRRLYPALRVVLTSGYSHVLAQEGLHGFDLLQKPYSVDSLNMLLRGTSSRDGR